MPRFTPATEAALLAAGWFEGRTVPGEVMDDWLVINWFPHYTAPQGYSKISPRAWRVLREFGGLSIGRAGRANTRTHPLVMNPLLVPDCGAYIGGLESFVWEIGASLFPLGTIEYDIKSHAVQTKGHAIAICDDGRVFALDYRCRLLGNSFEEALEKIVSGEIDEQEPFDYDDEYNPAEEELTRQVVNAIEKRIFERERQLINGQWPDQPTTLGQANSSGFSAITDWDAEAKHIARAFGLTEKYHFFGPHKMKCLLPKNGVQYPSDAGISLGGALLLRVTYNADYRFFHLSDSQGGGDSIVIVRWNGDVSPRNRESMPAARFLAKGLFNLGLLTPEIEEKLQLTLTQHEKLEWGLEFEKLQ